MFSEWSDPYDIDEYYDDLYNAFKDVIPTKQYSKPAVQLPTVATTEAPEEPVKPIVNGPSPVKNGFEVEPNSIFIDGHSVGSQPAYNILRSGPSEKKEDKEGFVVQGTPFISGEYAGGITWTHIIIFIAFVFLICLLAQMRAQLNNATMTMKMLTMMYSHDKLSKKDI